MHPKYYIHIEKYQQQISDNREHYSDSQQESINDQELRKGITNHLTLTTVIGTPG